MSDLLQKFGSITMKKTLLAVALASGFAGTAQAAATSVTLYGLIDSGIGYEQVKGPNGFKQSHVGATNGVSSGSRWGLKGAEDLGDGLQAVFTLEAGFNNQTGNSEQSGRLFGRQATVGLSSSAWGKLEFGRQTNMASKYLADISPFGTDYGMAGIGSTFGSAKSLRLDNMVMYQSPDFSGFRFGLGYSFNADTTKGDNFSTSDNPRVVTAGAKYASGPLTLVATYDRLSPNHAATNGESQSVQEYALGGMYDFEVVKLHAAWGQTFDGWFSGYSMGTNPSFAGYSKLPSLAYKDGAKVNSLMLGATVPLGKTKVFGSWQRADPKNDKLTGGDKTYNIFALGATYDLSKRTNLYAYAAYGDNYAFHDEVRNTAVAVGLRHRF
ncbi:outer membrane porin protein precursor [Bordetella parapertussis Bpp5]|uniref:Outer membrane porin protein n=2 Tax=Bordetella parapertussis TaxID=519 RepID=K0MKL1_BORPB|nr:outer membrane porin protein precursor [Bordetella parapertussis Bpp5]